MIAQWKGLKLTRCAVVRSTKVWAELREGEVLPTDDDVGGPVPAVCKGSGCGHLFSVLMELPMPQWKESRENILCCLKILTLLAEDCPLESLHRFEPLLRKETILFCLEREEPGLTLSALRLLTLLFRAEDLVGGVCCYGTGEPCLLATCYQCLLDPPSSAGGEVTSSIQLQVL